MHQSCETKSSLNATLKYLRSFHIVGYWLWQDVKHYALLMISESVTLFTDPYGAAYYDADDLPCRMYRTNSENSDNSPRRDVFVPVLFCSCNCTKCKTVNASTIRRVFPCTAYYSNRRVLGGNFQFHQAILMKLLSSCLWFLVQVIVFLGRDPETSVPNRVDENCTHEHREPTFKDEAFLCTISHRLVIFSAQPHSQISATALSRSTGTAYRYEDVAGSRTGQWKSVRSPCSLKLSRAFTKILFIGLHILARSHRSILLVPFFLMMKIA